MKNYGFVKVATGIPLVKIADCRYNAEQIYQLIQKADRLQVELLVLPEMSITAYTCGDLFFQPFLLQSAENALFDLLDKTTSLQIVFIVGLPITIDGQLFNVAAVCQKGRILGLVPKSYLPNYNEFQEMRWFTSGRDLSIKETTICGQRVSIDPFLLFKSEDFTFAVEICEDLWAPVPHSTLLSLAGAEILLNLSADNELIGKHDYLESLIRHHSAQNIAGYVYSSCGYGESTTDIVFSGKGLIAENGILVDQTERFLMQSQLLVTDIDIEKLSAQRANNTTFSSCKKRHASALSPSVIEWEGRIDHSFDLYRTIDPHPFVPKGESLHARCEEIFNIQTTALAQRLERSGALSAVIGISGGLDSTLALLVIVKTFDKLGWDRNRIIGITMPGFGTTDRTHNNALDLMHALQITSQEISIKQACLQHFQDIEHPFDLHDVTYENSQARERTQILMDIANQHNALVIGTGDLSELALGWATYNGDHMSMYGVNAGIPKTLIQSVVRWAALYEAQQDARTILLDIIDTPISPELLPATDQGDIAQKTEDLVGPYPLHDFFLYHFLRTYASAEKIYFLAQRAFMGVYDDATIKHWLKIFFRRFFSQQFKRSCLPDGPKVGSVSLSPRGDWRMASDVSATMWLDQIENL